MESYQELEIMKMQEGGYMVSRKGGRGDIPYFLFASTTVDDSLKFIKGKLEPKVSR